MLLVAGQAELGPVGQLERHPVDPDPGEALLGQVVEERAVLALAAAHDRGQDLEAGALGQLEDAVDDLLGGLAGHRAPAVRAVGMADAGVEQPQVVVDLGDRPDRRARVPRGGLLVDGDGRRQALDEVDVGLVHLAEELAGVGRQRLDVAALALGVDGVEGERGLARAREPGEDDQLVPGQVEGDVTQVVLAGPANDQMIGHPSEDTGGLCPLRLSPGQGVGTAPTSRPVVRHAPFAPPRSHRPVAGADGRAGCRLRLRGSPGDGGHGDEPWKLTSSSPQ